MLAILVDPMADVWMASVIILVLVRVDSKRVTIPLPSSKRVMNLLRFDAWSCEKIKIVCVQFSFNKFVRDNNSHFHIDCSIDLSYSS